MQTPGSSRQLGWHDKGGTDERAARSLVGMQNVQLAIGHCRSFPGTMDAGRLEAGEPDCYRVLSYYINSLAAAPSK